MSEFLYSVYEGFDGRPMIGRARITKRTEKRLYLQVDDGNGAAFRWSAQAPHDRYDTSPEAAIERYRARVRRDVEHAEKQIARANRNLTATPKRIYKEDAGGNQAGTKQGPVTPSASAAQK